MTEERKRPVLRDPRVPKFPVIFAKPTFEQIKDNFSTTDYTQWAGMGASCFPMGYIIGRQLDRSLARPGALFTGVMGCIGGFLLAYQNSELRLKGFGRNDDEVARYLKPNDSIGASSDNAESMHTDDE